MLLVCSVDAGGAIFPDTSANARIAPQKTVLEVSSKFLKCSCVKNATIVNRHYGKSPRADPVLFFALRACVYVYVCTSTCAAIWEGSCEV